MLFRRISSSPYWTHQEQQGRKTAWAVDLPCSRYRMHGACNKGNDCEFSHDLKNSKSDMNCTYYKQGKCTYGDKCRYNHIKNYPPPPPSPPPPTV
ncbi:hypothetical protein QQF64_026175 [Cirrhinus molitorella]|uniref:RING-type E3 ubiquitin transferase n=1 Tax=Cirrhinus molitorella TaxID=172907 RepID=A0ABR3NRK9_9TELE